MRMKTWKWLNMDTGEPVAESQQEAIDSSNPPCPNCGKKSEYWEGQIDQDFMGNDIRGWSFDCYACNICTEAVEGDYD